MLGSRPHQTMAERPRWIRKPLSATGRADFPIVAIGASAGGLDACRKLLDALPAHNRMAFIIVQHLDPSHDSMMVDLLAGHTSMPVLLATDGMKIERERVYVIPPGVYLSVDEKGGLRLSKPLARHGARLPFDFLLNSLAREYGARAVCVVLSGTGSDGSLGLKAVKESGGLVVAQDIGEADYDGMPRSAIATGAVDLVLRTAKIAEALVARERGQIFVSEGPESPALKSVEELLPDIIALLRTKTVHDFALYKRGTLERRVERRMALAGASSPTLCAITRWTGRCASGLPVAVPAKRPIRSRCFFVSGSTPRSATSNCRSSRPTSIPTRWRALVKASIPTRSRPMCRQSDWPNFLPRRIASTGSRLGSARASCSRCMTCSPTRHSRVSISFRAAKIG